ncbi:exodeoxyribonuclease V subunit gamma [Pseudothauera nasutitermitis]|uniref:RecBCD enzyme subunit RecC n=1 Tax=Pseudothauera nasutitermitis TaxID=2565930 RepID=A0A4S4ASJ8_9RHOO|nr:exodeoxyribonuclease V subunit gamma [Pseudothauera nasutitermitis]THF62855.1 exodeoxyribonuclease V subunit gamma [Pseudothauera nasutitermitis]
MFAVAFSNRFEVLLDLLLDRLAEERPGPFGRRELVVPSSALRRHVELAVAGREGVAADLGFDFLAQWLWKQIRRAVPDIAERSPYAPALLAWRIHALLGEDGAWTAAHRRLADYLAAADERMRYELAVRIARVFDHYLTYRPNWLAAWGEGRGALPADAGAAQRADEAWQAELWRHLQANMPRRQEHPAAAFVRLLRGMDARQLGELGLPARVHVFGLPALPPLYLDLLRELGRVVDVRLYLLNPCREYWFDVVDARRLSWLARRQADLFLDTGNRLLAAWGRQTQAQIDQLFEGEHEVAEEAVFVEHPGGHLLARVHNAILDLAELEPGSVELDAVDRSIEVHVCHSRVRELEALHDRLLGLFAADPALRPADVLVLTPDLEGCAPLIEAVFGTAPAARRIPWRITGLAASGENAVARVLDTLLAMAAGRFPASQVFGLLQQPVVAARFGLDAQALERVHEWMRASGMRWGLRGADAGHAAPWSLEEGLHRLYLGWAAGGGVAAPFAGRVGAQGPEGGEALALGRLWRYLDTLKQLREQLLRPHDAAGWRRVLNGVLDRLVADGADRADDLRAVRAAIAALAGEIEAAGVRAEVSLDVARVALAAHLDDPARGGVPGGEVTFSALSALRGLPCKVVAVIGLDQGAFPGSARADEFDLMAAFPRKGDRQRRDDERNLFLDVLLATREVLHLSYTGRGVRDGAELPPSVLVDELLDVLAESCATDAGDPAALAAARRRLVVEHPLQAFSAEYFLPAERSDLRLLSHHEEYAAALAARLAASAAPVQQDACAFAGDGREDGDEDDEDDSPGPGGDAPPFFNAPLPPPEPAWREVSLARLTRFLRNPCRYLLRERLGLELPEGGEELADVEPFLPERAARRALAARLAPLLEGGQIADADTLLAVARAGAEYPAGTLGDDALRAELSQLNDYAERLRAARAGRALAAHEARVVVLLDGEAWSLSASFADLREDGWTLARYEDAGVGDYLAAWLGHLLLCADPPAGGAYPTRVVARDGDALLRVLPADEARARLAELLGCYRDGLRRPLPFFLWTAWAYVIEGRKRSAARKRWEGGPQASYAESRDAAIRLALRGAGEVLDDAFFARAEALLGPLLDALAQPDAG